MEIKLEANINIKRLEEQFKSLVDDKCMYEIHDMFAKLMNDYVPFAEGYLSQGVTIQNDRVIYPGPYAHYQYVGEVYGPNIPIIQDGILVGFFSPPGQKKKPTGREIQYNKEYHPKASKEWDKAMMNERGEEFLKKVKEILLQRCAELYG